MVNLPRARNWLLSWFDHSDILREVNGKTFVYMRRHKLLTTKHGEVRIHEIMMSDLPEFLHDHPFDFFTIMLSGVYDETYRDPWVLGDRGHVKLRRAPSIRWTPGERLHTLSLRTPKVWTLCITGPRRRTWGFAHGDVWKEWSEVADASRYREVPGTGWRVRFRAWVETRVHNEWQKETLDA